MSDTSEDKNKLWLSFLGGFCHAKGMTMEGFVMSTGLGMYGENEIKEAFHEWLKHNKLE